MTQAAMRHQEAAHSGKLTARERLLKLYDAERSRRKCSSSSRSAPPSSAFGDKQINADAVVCGFGSGERRTVFAAAQDFTSAGGSLARMHARKIWKVMDMAKDAKNPSSR